MDCQKLCTKSENRKTAHDWIASKNKRGPHKRHIGRTGEANEQRRRQLTGNKAQTLQRSTREEARRAEKWPMLRETTELHVADDFAKKVSN